MAGLLPKWQIHFTLRLQFRTIYGGELSIMDLVKNDKCKNKGEQFSPYVQFLSEKKATSLKYTAFIVCPEQLVLPKMCKNSAGSLYRTETPL